MICPTCGYDNLPGAELCVHCQQDLATLDLPAPVGEVERSLQEDPVSILQPHPPVTISPEASLREAIQLMLQLNLGSLMVVDEQQRLLGIFSERDLMTRVVAVHESLEGLQVRQFMTPSPETVNATDKLNFALHKMDVGGYRHLPVIADGRPVGMVSVRDMLRHLTELE